MGAKVNVVCGQGKLFRQAHQTSQGENMKITFNIVKATVTKTKGTDKVVLETDKHPGGIDSAPNAPLCFCFDITYDKGADYCRKELGIEPIVF